MIVSSQEYKRLYSEMHSSADFGALSKRFRIPRETLDVIFHQKLTRRVRSHYHRLKAGSIKLNHEWEAGASFIELSAKHNFSPLMIASLVLQRRGFTKPRVSALIKDPSRVNDERIERELNAASVADPAFSPWGISEQRRRALECEDGVRKWLQSHGAEFKHESEQAKTGKTPDYLLDKPVSIHGHLLNWIECKASFGDHDETKRNLSQQLTHYHKLFGPGMVVYWYGVEENPVTYEGIIVATKDFLE
ncbi:TPA: TPD domain-containing protein [Candidatus Micrarchaeota archaeon]|nr:TPD domain-containing protein [Candidatus Micrarchaeota archaeon]